MNEGGGIAIKGTDSPEIWKTDGAVDHGDALAELERFLFIQDVTLLDGDTWEARERRDVSLPRYCA